MLQPHWQGVLKVSKAAIGNTLFFVLFAVGSLMFVVGKLQQRYKVKTLVLLGSIISALSLIFLSRVNTLQGLYLWAFLIGASSAFIYIPTITAVQISYPHKKGLVSGIVNLSFGFSAALMSPVFYFMLKGLGYGPMCVLLAAFSLFFGVMSSFFITIPEERKDSEQKVSILTERDLTVRSAIKTKAFWALWLTWAFQGAGCISMVSLAVNFGLSRGLDAREAVLILTCFNITNGLSRIFMGYLSDRFSGRLVMSSTFLLAGSAYIILFQIHSPLLYFIGAALVGLAFGTMFSVSAPLAAECFGLRHFGSIFGLIFTAYGYIAGLLGPTLSNYLLDITSANYTLVFMYLGSLCLFSSYLITLVRPRY